METKLLIDPIKLIEEITAMKKVDPYKPQRGLIERWVRNEGYDISTLLVKHFPTVDAVEVVHGYWVSDKADILFHCSECETQISTDWDYDDLIWNYCPNCGAKMDGAGNGN